MTGLGFSCDARDREGGGGLTRDERDAMRSMRWPDGRPMERGDLVEVAGEPGLRRYEVIGWHLGRGLVMLRDAGGRVSYAPPRALVRS